MAALYLALFGWGLRSWCRSVHPALGGVLAGTLLGLNALVILGPLAQAVIVARQDALHRVLGTGFYLGFFALAAAVRHFGARVLTADLAKERRVSWFVGATLVVTYVEVFGWVHAFIRYLPQTHTYAALVVIAGGVSCSPPSAASSTSAGRRATRRRVLPRLRVRPDRRPHGDGRALVRVLVLLLAGLVWLRQAERAERRPPSRHRPRCCSASGIAAVGLLDGVPTPLARAIGIGLAGLLAGLWRRGSGGRTDRSWRDAARSPAAGRVAPDDGRRGPHAVALPLRRPGDGRLAPRRGCVLRAHAKTARSLRALVTTRLVLAAALPYARLRRRPRTEPPRQHDGLWAGVVAAVWLVLDASRRQTISSCRRALRAVALRRPRSRRDDPARGRGGTDPGRPRRRIGPGSTTAGPY